MREITIRLEFQIFQMKPMEPNTSSDKKNNNKKRYNVKNNNKKKRYNVK